MRLIAHQVRQGRSSTPLSADQAITSAIMETCSAVRGALFM